MSDLATWLAAIKCGALLEPLDTEHGIEDVEDLLDLEPEHISQLCQLLKTSPAKKFRRAMEALALHAALPGTAVGAGGASPILGGGGGGAPASKVQSVPEIDEPKPEVSEGVPPVTRGVHSKSAAVTHVAPMTAGVPVDTAPFMGVPSELVIFGSMRFPVPPEALELFAALQQHGVFLKIVDMAAGQDIDKEVYQWIKYADTFLVFGTHHYGEDTGNSACTYNELKFAQGKGKKIVLLRMIPWDQEFENLQAEVLFNRNILTLEWQPGTPMPPTLVGELVRALDGVASSAVAAAAASVNAAEMREQVLREEADAARQEVAAAYATATEMAHAAKVETLAAKAEARAAKQSADAQLQQQAQAIEDAKAELMAVQAQANASDSAGMAARADAGGLPVWDAPADAAATQAKVEAEAEEAEATKIEFDLRQIMIADEALPPGCVVYVNGLGFGTYVSFRRSIYGANKHTIKFETAKTSSTRVVELRGGRSRVATAADCAGLKVAAAAARAREVATTCTLQQVLGVEGTVLVTKSGVCCFGTGLGTVCATGAKVRKGAVFYEITVQALGLMQIGWATSPFADDCVLEPYGTSEMDSEGNGTGDDLSSWAIDGVRINKWTGGDEVSWGEKFNEGDTIGCAFDVDSGRMMFGRNGVWDGNMGLAFQLPRGTSVFPSLSGAFPLRVAVNFGDRPWAFGPPDPKFESVIVCSGESVVFPDHDLARWLIMTRLEREFLSMTCATIMAQMPARISDPRFVKEGLMRVAKAIETDRCQMGDAETGVNFDRQFALGVAIEAACAHLLTPNVLEVCFLVCCLLMIEGSSDVSFEDGRPDVHMAQVAHAKGLKSLAVKAKSTHKGDETISNACEMLTEMFVTCGLK